MIGAVACRRHVQTIAGSAVDAEARDRRLIMGGIHAPLFRSDPQRAPIAAALERLKAEFGARPDWVLPRFRWRLGG